MEAGYITIQLEGVEQESEDTVTLLVNHEDDLLTVTCQRSLLTDTFGASDTDTILLNCSIDLTAKIEGKTHTDMSLIYNNTIVISINISPPSLVPNSQ